MTGQAPSHVVLVRSHHFRPNPQTAADNTFQHALDAPAEQSARRAAAEVDGLAEVLAAAGVGVTVVDDEGIATPDSVFPNNWLSTHADGTLALYPMYAPNRRAERRDDVIERLRERFEVRRVGDFAGAARRGRARAGADAQGVCAELGYVPVLFEASDADGVPVYHTNVLMSVGTEIALVGSGMIRDAQQRARVLGSLRASGRDVVELSETQVHGFLGNCLELLGTERLLVMSAQAAAQLTAAQRHRIERSCRILTAPVPTIEAAGGSVRCMLAGIHLPQQQAEARAGVATVAAPRSAGYGRLSCDTSDDEVDRERRMACRPAP